MNGFATSGKPWTMFSPTDTILNIGSSIFNIGIFLKMLEESGLDELLQGDEEYTIFAPKDIFFLQMKRNALEILLSDNLMRYQILANHIVKGKMSVSDLLEKKTVKSIQGGDLSIDNVKRIYVQINEESKIIEFDINGRNGYLHIVDKMIFPEKLFT